MNKLLLNFYEACVVISSNSDYVLEELSKNFYFFLSKEDGVCTKGTIHINLSKDNPPYDRVPPLEASVHDIGSISYKDGSTIYTDYSGNGLMIYDFNKEQGDIFSQDEYLLYEKAKLTILSRLGELWDRAGIHRLHALGLSKNGKAVICLLPIEGGKTTISMNVLKLDNSIKLISDDMCLIDKRGQVYPLVVRVGVRDIALTEGIPKDQVIEINSPKYGRKFLINAAYFADRISVNSRLSYILIGKRVFQDQTTIRPVPFLEFVVSFIESVILGSGLPKLKEFFFRGGLLVSLRRIQAVCSRSLSFFSLIYHAKVYDLKIGRDKNQTARALVDFINEAT